MMFNDKMKRIVCLVLAGLMVLSVVTVVFYVIL